MLEINNTPQVCGVPSTPVL